MRTRSHRRPVAIASQRGIALVLALWLTILLTVIASGFAFSMRSEALATRNALSLAQARAAADGAIERAAYELQRPRLPDAWALDGVPHYWQDGDIAIKVVAVDEAARIDLNVAPDALLKSMLLSQGLDDEKATSIAAAIADWRDPDDFKRPSGAEEADYREAGLKYGPANGPFETVAEVGRVLGVSGDLYSRLSNLCTVYSRQPGINPLTASRDVLLTLPNATAEGAMTCQPCGASSAIWLSPSQGRLVLALRPAWPSWMAGTAPAALIAAATGFSAAACWSFQRPVSPHVMRPSGDTSVISTVTSPAPPTASCSK